LASFTWKHPQELARVDALETTEREIPDEMTRPLKVPQDLEERYVADPDIDRESVAAWEKFVKQLSDPAKALNTFLNATAGLQRPSTSTQKRVFISHRMGTAHWAGRIAWLASKSAGLEYWLDVHDPVLRWANATLPPTDPRYAATIAAIIEMALLNCTHVIAMHTPPPAPPPGQPPAPWIPSQWIPYEIGRAKGRTVFSGQMSGWFHGAVHPHESRGEYVLLADRRSSDPDVERWLISQGTDARNNPAAQKNYHGTATPNPLP